MKSTQNTRLWFKKGRYRGKNSRGSEPLWHAAKHPYLAREMYMYYEALCGYTIEAPWRQEIKLSKAQRLRGRRCSSCEKKVDKEATTAAE